MLLSSFNYKLILIGVAMIILGYVIMYFERDVDGVLSLYVAPLILVGGYLEIIYALLWRPKEVREEDVSLEEVLEERPAERQEA